MLDQAPARSGVTRAEILRRLHDPKLTLLNVLNSTVFAQGRIPGSLNIPIEELGMRARSELRPLDRDIIVYCGGHT